MQIQCCIAFLWNISLSPYRPSIASLQAHARMKVFPFEVTGARKPEGSNQLFIAESTPLVKRPLILWNLYQKWHASWTGISSQLNLQQQCITSSLLDVILLNFNCLSFSWRRLQSIAHVEITVYKLHHYHTAPWFFLAAFVSPKVATAGDGDRRHKLPCGSLLTN